MELSQVRIFCENGQIFFPFTANMSAGRTKYRNVALKEHNHYQTELSQQWSRDVKNPLCTESSQKMIKSAGAACGL